MRLCKHQHRPQVHLNMAPMIDVVFLLIIFGMVVSQFSRVQAEPVKLPDARQGQKAEPKTTPIQLIINIRSSGAVVMQQTICTDNMLAEKLDQAVATRGPNNVCLTVRCDRQTPWPQVRRVLNACRQRGIHRIQTAVQAQPDPED